MKQSTVHDSNRIDIDFSRPGIPSSAEMLHPDLIQEGGMYQCIWQSRSSAAITGEGETPEQALQNWDKKIQEIVCNTTRNDELANQLKELLISKEREPDESRKSKDAFDVTDGIPLRSQVNPENGVEKRSRKYTTDESNRDGSELL